MAYKHIEVQPISGACGAEIFGADLSKPLKNDVFAEVYKAWLTHQVVFFRDQKITPEQQIKFAKKWGGIHLHPFVKGLAKHPQILEVKKTETDTDTFGNRWHTDQMFAPSPAKATILYAKHGKRVIANILAGTIFDQRVYHCAHKSNTAAKKRAASYTRPGIDLIAGDRPVD